MSTRAGEVDYFCDKCGVSVGNGGAQKSTKVIGRDPSSPFALRQLDFCVAERIGAPFGCTGNIIGPSALADLTAYNETRNTA